MTFLALTSAQTRHRWIGIALTGILTANRETIGVAVVHALAWHLSHMRTRERGQLAPWGTCVAHMALAGTAVFAARKLISAGLNHPIEASFSWMEGEQIRLLANLERMVTKHHHGITLLWFGAGAILWLPRRWRALDQQIRHRMWTQAAKHPCQPDQVS